MGTKMADPPHRIAGQRKEEIYVWNFGLTLRLFELPLEKPLGGFAGALAQASEKSEFSLPTWAGRPTGNRTDCPDGLPRSPLCPISKGLSRVVFPPPRIFSGRDVKDYPGRAEYWSEGRCRHGVRPREERKNSMKETARAHFGGNPSVLPRHRTPSALLT